MLGRRGRHVGNGQGMRGVRGQKGRHKSGNNQSWPTLSSRSSCGCGMCSKASSRSSKSGGSALNNVFERLLSAQMGDFYQNILSEYISAYRRHHSCETSLLRLTEDWRRSLDNKEIVAVISMDLSKAFDTIPHALPLMQEHFL